MVHFWKKKIIMMSIDVRACKFDRINTQVDRKCYIFSSILSILISNFSKCNKRIRLIKIACLFLRHFFEKCMVTTILSSKKQKKNTHKQRIQNSKKHLKWTSHYYGLL